MTTTQMENDKEGSEEEAEAVEGEEEESPVAEVRSNQSSSSKQAATPPKKEPLMKFGVNTATTNYAPYATVHEKIATYIQKNYDCGHDIAKSICTGQLIDLDAKKPIRTLAAGDKKAKRDLIQSGLDIECSARMSAHVKREQFLHSNLPKAFTYIMNDYCTEGLKNQLIAIPDYEFTIRDDQLALLIAIKTCVHENTHTQYPPVTILTHWDRLLKLKLKLKQAEEEDPPSCAKRFEQQLETVKGYIGSTFTGGFAAQMPEYKAHTYKSACMQTS